MKELIVLVLLIFGVTFAILRFTGTNMTKCPQCGSLLHEGINGDKNLFCIKCGYYEVTTPEGEKVLNVPAVRSH